MHVAVNQNIDVPSDMTRKENEIERESIRVQRSAREVKGVCPSGERNVCISSTLCIVMHPVIPRAHVATLQCTHAREYIFARPETLSII